MSALNIGLPAGEVSPRIGAEHRAVLRTVAEALIPAGAGLPSAVDVGIDAGLLDQVLTVRPDLAEPLLVGLDILAGEAAHRIAARVDAEPGLAVVGLVVAGGYLMSQTVADALRYPWQEAKIVRPDDVFQAIEDGLLDAVMERGPIYRLPPDAPQEAVDAVEASKRG
ncbi:hypothetical protein [Microbacterium sp. Root180]|uniref:hypothetical protein n=1 Tax=Microbacterium sp. Root180 TaxID=1736483 RepID=UPI0006F92301|nr:hypothetical protein [Microbacterium sp. Root180]KRB36632.1 hypothetical protein ASD93_11300 [Microbacterium sp. Root180]